jgi:hypothetical protein
MIEDRRLKIDDRGSSEAAIAKLNPRFSILYPRPSILHPPSSSKAFDEN